MKILVVGDANTGKTSICKKIVFDAFSTNYKATIGVDFYSKKLRLDDSTTVRLQLWDIAGNERFGSMTKAYYREAVGAIVVYDVTKARSFASVKRWKRELDENVAALSGLPPGSDFALPAVLVGNKADLIPAVVSAAAAAAAAGGSVPPAAQAAVDTAVVEAAAAARTPEVDEMLSSMHFTGGWFATSAKTSLGVKDSMSALVRQILDSDTSGALSALGASKRGVVGVGGTGPAGGNTQPPESSCC
eukprot:SAG22_NODE_1392_length_4514_cov_4.559909_1_plen_246_part_00